MLPRASLFAICLAWMAYESHFSPRYFTATVGKSLAEIQAGLDSMLNRELPPVWRTAATETEPAQDQ